MTSLTSTSTVTTTIAPDSTTLLEVLYTVLATPGQVLSGTPGGPAVTVLSTQLTAFTTRPIPISSSALPVTSSNTSGAVVTTLPPSVVGNLTSTNITSAATTSSSSRLNQTATGVSTSTSEPTSQSDSSNAGTTYGSGAAAGFAVGFFILGVILAAAITYWFFNRRSKQQAKSYHDGSPESMSMQPHEKGPIVAATTLGVGSAAAIIEESLPQPRQDRDVRSDISSLKTRIDAHIGEYYTSGTSDPLAAGAAIAAAIGPKAPISTARVPELLKDSRRCSSLLRASLSWVILTRVGPDAASNDTLLPPTMASLYIDQNLSRMDDATRAVFTSKWRQITAALAGDRLTGDINESDSRIPAVSRSSQIADSFLVHFARPGDQTDRLQKLTEIVKRAARLDAMLFSQATTYHFDWSGEDSRLVTFPGLVQLRGEDGKILRSRNELMRQENEPL